MNEPNVVPPGQLTLIDKRLVLNAIIDAVSRIPGFSLQANQPQPPDDPVPPGSVLGRLEAALNPPRKKPGRKPGTTAKKPTGGAAHKKFVAKKGKG